MDTRRSPRPHAGFASWPPSGSSPTVARAPLAVTYQAGSLGGLKADFWGAVNPAPNLAQQGDVALTLEDAVEIWPSAPASAKVPMIPEELGRYFWTGDELHDPFNIHADPLPSFRDPTQPSQP